MSNDIGAWSPTRALLFSACPKAFFRATKQSREGRSAVFAPTVPELIGRAVHQAVSAEIGAWADGRGFNMFRARDSADAAIEQELHGRNVAVGSMEPNWDEAQEASARARIHKILLNFGRFVWPLYSGHSYLTHERRAAFDLGDLRVVVQPDLVTRDFSDVVVVTDWKTSRQVRLENEELQLGAYILWAAGEYGIPPAEIEGRIVSLADGSMRSSFGSRQLMDKTTDRIRGDMSIWSRTAAEAFPARPEFLRCSRCHFLNECNEGRQAVAVPDASMSPEDDA